VQRAKNRLLAGYEKPSIFISQSNLPRAELSGSSSASLGGESWLDGQWYGR
jgi:hypothetical protein